MLGRDKHLNTKEVGSCAFDFLLDLWPGWPIDQRLAKRRTPAWALDSGSLAAEGPANRAATLLASGS